MNDPRDSKASQPEASCRTDVTEAPSADAGAEAKRYRDRWVRVSADLDNLRKRTRREVDAARRSQRANILLDCLEILDNLERALALAGPQPDEWLEGVEVTHRQTLAILERHGAEPFECLGTQFDPSLHEAISVVHVPGRREGEVVDVVQRGYSLDGALLRAAQVVVNGSKN